MAANGSRPRRTATSAATVARGGGSVLSSNPMTADPPTRAAAMRLHAARQRQEQHQPGQQVIGKTAEDAGRAAADLSTGQQVRQTGEALVPVQGGPLRQPHHERRAPEVAHRNQARGVGGVDGYRVGGT